MSSVKTKILIVDDHPVVREGLALRINRQSDLQVCGEAGSPAEALRMIAECRPDVLVADLMLESGSGLDLIQDAMSRYPKLLALAVSMQDERIFAPRALKNGARGYIMKQVATEKIVEAIRSILAGHVYLSDEMRLRMLDGLGRAKSGESGTVEQLSDRELEVYRLVGEGFRTREIASKLHLSVKTIETYYERIKKQLNYDDFHQLFREAVLWVNR